MTKEEGIDLAIELAKKYDAAEKILEKISDLEERIRRPDDESVKRYSSFDFFTPFLAGSFITAFVLGIPAFMMCSVSRFLYMSGNESYKNTPYVVMLILIAVFALIHLIGGFVARKKRDINNESAANAIYANRKLKETFKHDIEDYKEQLYKIAEELGEYDDIIPSNLRSKAKMDRVKFFLISKKAETFEDALTLAGNEV